MSQSFRSRLKDWKLDRRRFLYATGGLAGLVATSPLQALTEKVTPSFSTNPFTLGVASGDPLADSVMLWTRLARRSRRGRRSQCSATSQGSTKNSGSPPR